MRLLRLTVLAAAASSAGCALLAPPETVGPPAKETILAVTPSGKLLRFNAGRPQQLLDRRDITGMQRGDVLVGIDVRVAKGQVFGLARSGQLYRIDAGTAAATPVGPPVTLPAGTEWGFDFNPVVDRIRVVSNAGFNLRLHPETGAIVDGDAQQPGVQLDGLLRLDGPAGAPRIVAVAYTYNQDDEKLTTNYALDGASATLMVQGSKEGATPVVSPNTGRLSTVGPLGLPPFARASFDISDVSNTAYAGIGDHLQTRWYRLDLATGQARFIGTVGGGEAILGSAIEP